MNGIEVVNEISNPAIRDFILSAAALSLFTVSVAVMIVRIGLPKGYRDRVLSILEKIEASNTKVRVETTHDAKLVKSAFYKQQLAEVTKHINSIYDQNGLDNKRDAQERIKCTIMRAIDNTDCDLFAIEGMPLFMAPTSDKKSYVLSHTDMIDNVYDLLIRARTTVSEVQMINHKVAVYAAKHVITVGMEDIYISTLQQVTNKFYKDDGRPKK